MKKLSLFWCVMSLIFLPADIGLKKAEGCTIGVASGKATADGRPLLWRNRDGWGRAGKVVYRKDGRFKIISTSSSGHPPLAVGAGVNEVGFCIVEAGAFDLQDKSGRIPGVRNILSRALQQCVTVDDFESLLK